MAGRKRTDGGPTDPDSYDDLHGETTSLLPSPHRTINDEDVEAQSISSPTKGAQQTCWDKTCTERQFGGFHVLGAFLLGSVACLLGQYALCGTNCFTRGSASSQGAAPEFPMYGLNGEGFATAYAPPWAGSTQVHPFPPAKPSNAFPELFPSRVGYAGATPTGAEPAVIITAPSYPTHTGQCSHELLRPAVLERPVSLPDASSKIEGHDITDDGLVKHGKGKKKKKPKFNLFRSWGNLSPWYSVDQGAFGLDSSPGIPDTCRVTGLHFLHRHGARYPTAWASYGGPSKFATKLHQSPESWNASHQLSFLNEWTYKLGEELLTPFGRQQLYDLGVSLRMKYGFLLQNFTEQNVIPVFRTESQDRMLASAMNFAIGFFGYPFEGQYQQSITIEADGFNNTLAPYKTCPNANDKAKAERGNWYTERWADIYLKDAHSRLQKALHGLDITIEDVYTMQQLCSYETVALGYSTFCELFTEEEWEGFNYALDLSFWYNSAFGSPMARVQGVGYVQEMVARLTHTPIQTHNTSTNGTLNDNPITFPLGQSLYVDATHEVVVLNIITALNLTTFAESGPLPYTHIPHDRSFRVSELAPFATNIQFQLLECTSVPGQQIRVIINDGVAPLTGVKGCPKQKDGMCPVSTFVEAQKETIQKTDWNWDCHGDWEVPPGDEWTTVTGDPPAKQH